MKKKRGNSLLVGILIVVVVLFLGTFLFRTFGVQSVVYSVAVSAHSVLPKMPISVNIQRNTISVPFWQDAPRPPALLSSETQMCAKRYIPAGVVMRDSYVEPCKGYVALSVELPPEMNSPTLHKGNGAMVCFVAEGPVARDMCEDGCLPADDVSQMYPFNPWEVNYQVRPLEYTVPDGLICATGYLGDALNAFGQPVELCEDVKEDSRVTIGSGDTTTASPMVNTEGGSLGDDDDCREEPPVSRVVVVPPGAIPFFGRMEFYKDVSERLLFAGNIPVINSTVLFKVDEQGVGRWYRISDLTPWAYDENIPETGIEPGEIEEEGRPDSPTITPTQEAEIDTVVQTPTVEPTRDITATITLTESMIVTDTEGITITVLVDNLIMYSAPDGLAIGELDAGDVVTMTTFNGLLDNPWIGIVTESEWGWVSGDENYIDFHGFSLREYLENSLRTTPPDLAITPSPTPEDVTN